MSEPKDTELPIAVYVHLGPNLPKHLFLSLHRHLMLFPKQELVLITSHDQEFDLPHSIQQFKVNCYELQADLFNEMAAKLDFNFRNGFWKYTLQRFFAIGEFHKVVPNRSITHIESDVLLMPNFPWDSFRENRKLSWLNVNSELDVAAIVHFPNLEKSIRLLNQIEILCRINPGTNDMLVLNECAINLGDHHSYLPSLTSQVTRHGKSLSNLQKPRLDSFGWIFDPLNLGLWYFGQDPKNSFGLRTRYVGDDSHNLDSKKTKLKFRDGVLTDGNGTLVFSLHVHSKYLPLFGKNWEEALKRGLDEAASGTKAYSFHLGALLQAFRGNKARHNLWQLLSLIPGLMWFRKFPLVEKIKNSLKSLFRI